MNPFDNPPNKLSLMDALRRVQSTQAKPPPYTGAGSIVDNYLAHQEIAERARHAEFWWLSNDGRINALLKRLRMSRLDSGMDVHTSSTATVSSDTESEVFVFFRIGTKAIMLQDSIGMFPSDTLVTQLRVFIASTESSL